MTDLVSNGVCRHQARGRHLVVFRAGRVGGDVMFVMEKRHQRKLSEGFTAHLRGKRAICLGIPDDYEFLQPDLENRLAAKVGEHLR